MVIVGLKWITLTAGTIVVLYGGILYLVYRLGRAGSDIDSLPSGD